MLRETNNEAREMVMTIAAIARKKSALGDNQVSARMIRVLELPNLTFLTYRDYCKDSNGGWGYNTRIDGGGSYGDFKETDSPEGADLYFQALCADDTDSGELYFYVPFASGSDYSGGSVYAANAKWFNESFGSNEWVHNVWGGYNTYAVAVGLTGLLLCDDSTFDAVCDALEGLDGYPVFDDDTLSTLESEWTDSAWEFWAARDFKCAVEERFAGRAEFNWPSDSDLRSIFEGLAGNANVYWYNEGDGDSMYIDIAKIAESIDLDDCEGENGRDGLADYVVNYEVSYNDCGEIREDYSCESEAAGRVEELRSAGFAGAFYN
jgi:hypothetical protein